MEPELELKFSKENDFEFYFFKKEKKQ